jgi:short-subunit dehydrogenase
MMRSDAPDHVLITGGGGGLGAALAQNFARRGATTIGLCGRDATKLEAAAAACGGRARVTVCDVTDADRLRTWLIAADDARPVDCVIACAGIGGGAALAGPSGESPEVVRAVLDVNVQGVVNTVTPLMDRMIARRSGRIAIVSSLAGLIALPDSPAYCASKAAVVAYGEALRRLLRRNGVSVTVICPGFVDTDMARSLSMRPPFLWTAEKAAAAMADGVVRRRALVAFPWQLRIAISLSRCLPRPVSDRLLDGARAKDFR